jgi:hypothetical protein
MAPSALGGPSRAGAFNDGRSDVDVTNGGQTANGRTEDPGTGQRRGLGCAERPHVVASDGAFNCAYACQEGFADCDDSRDNGCETDLSAPDACASCGLAFSCLMPELCGEAESTCSDGKVQIWTLSRSSGLPITLGGFAADDGGLHVMTMQGATFENTTQPIDVSGGIAFRHENGAIGDHLWTSLPGPDGGSPPKVERFGDQLIFFGEGDDAVVLTSTDLDGTQRWSARLPVSQSASPRDVILDSEGNVYLWVEVRSGNLIAGGKTYEATSFQQFNLLLSFSPSGALRWVSDDDLPDEVWDNAIEDWKALAIFDDRIAVLRRGEYSTFARTDGRYQGSLQTLNMFATFAEGEAFMEQDAAGNFYIASITSANATADEVPMPDGVPAGETEAPDRYHAHVTKLDSMRRIMWRRSLRWHDYVSEESPLPNDQGLHIDSFAVGADGFSWVLAGAGDGDTRRQFLVGLENDGRIAVARHMNPKQNTHFVRVTSDGTPHLVGTYEDLQFGAQLFEGAGVFLEQDRFDALAQ